MVSDVFMEQIVKRKDSLKDIAVKVIITAIGLALLAVAVVIQLGIVPYEYGGFTLLVVVGIAYYTWYIVSGLDLEFEYIYTNGELDIDKISAKRKRKRITSKRVAEFTAFEKYDRESFDKKKYAKVISACENSLLDNTYYIAFKSENGTETAILISPEERMLESLEKEYSRQSRIYKR